MKIKWNSEKAFGHCKGHDNEGRMTHTIFLWKIKLYVAHHWMHICFWCCFLK